MRMNGRSRRAGLVLGILLALGVLLGMASTPVWALGPGAPPIVIGPDAEVVTTDGGASRLWVGLDVEIPGGRVPQDVASVTVLVPGETSPRVVPRDNMDLWPDRAYFLDLTTAGVPGFPRGTYTFTVTDTAGGVTTVSDTLSSATPLASPTITSHTHNQIIPPTPPTVTWTPVSGAAIHRVYVRNGFMDHRFSQFTTGASLTLPGVSWCRADGFKFAWTHTMMPEAMGFPTLDPDGGFK